MMFTALDVAEPIRQPVDQDAIPHEERGLHGAPRDEERLNQERLDDDRDDESRNGEEAELPEEMPSFGPVVVCVRKRSFRRFFSGAGFRDRLG